MMTSLRTVVALLGGVAPILGACTGGGRRNTAAVPTACEIVSTGTPTSKGPSPAAAADWSVDPAAATGCCREGLVMGDAA